MNKPENFTLSKVKLPKGGGLTVKYSQKQIEKGNTDTLDVDISNSVNPHPDLISKVNELKEYLAKCYGMDSLLVLSRLKGLKAAEKKAFAAVSLTIENVHKENMKKIEITGVSISGSVDGDKDKRSVVITGTQLMENNSKTALNSPRIKLNTDQFKFESEVQDIINEIDFEVSEYLFNGKRAQLEIVFEGDKEIGEKFKKGDLSRVEDVTEEVVEEVK